MDFSPIQRYFFYKFDDFLKFNLMFLKIILIGITIFDKKWKMPFKKFYLKNWLQVTNFLLVFLDVFVSNNCYDLYLTYVNSLTPWVYIQQISGLKPKHDVEKAFNMCTFIS